MAYDEELAARVRDVLTDLVPDGPVLSERRMFGGLAFLVDGHMAAAATRSGLMLRIDPAEGDSLVDGRAVRRMEMRGRELDGWLLLDGPAVAADDQLATWVGRGVGYVRGLPPK